MIMHLEILNRLIFKINMECIKSITFILISFVLLMIFTDINFVTADFDADSASLSIHRL